MLGSHEPCVVVGARSSIFLPFSGFGLVIVDEEHESSYKQFDPAPRYNARDASMVLASMHGAKVVLGSATPIGGDLLQGGVWTIWACQSYGALW